MPTAKIWSIGSLSRKEDNNVVLSNNAKGQVTGENKNPHFYFHSAKLLWEKTLTLLLMASVTLWLSPFSLCVVADTDLWESLYNKSFENT